MHWAATDSVLVSSDWLIWDFTTVIISTKFITQLEFFFNLNGKGIFGLIYASTEIKFFYRTILKVAFKKILLSVDLNFWFQEIKEEVLASSFEQQIFWPPGQTLGDSSTWVAGCKDIWIFVVTCGLLLELSVL